MKKVAVLCRVNPETKDAIHRRAISEGISEADVVRRLIDIGLGQVPELNAPELPPSKEGYERKKITLTVPSFIVDLASERAAQKKMALSRWIAALIQTHVFQPPVSTMTELKLLNANLRELRSIGININQIARAFNQGDVDATRLDSITQFQTVLKNNRNIILGLLSSTNRSWGRQWD